MTRRGDHNQAAEGVGSLLTGDPSHTHDNNPYRVRVSSARRGASGGQPVVVGD
jgi:hypothetical protein